jgi:hypothetical protein
MEQEFSLQCSQERATGLYTEPDYTSQPVSTPFPWDSF